MSLLDLNTTLEFLQAAAADLPQPLDIQHNHHSVLNDLYTRDVITFSVMGVGGVFICSLGILGNIVSLIVLSRIQVALSTYTYLSALCVSDLCMLICTLLLLGNDLKIPRRGEHFEDGTYLRMFPYLNPLAFTFHVISVWLTLAFTLDRYIMICHPFRALSLCSVSRARKSSGAIFAAGIVLNLPRFFEYRTVQFSLHHAVAGNFTVHLKQVFCDLTEFGRSQIFKQIYHSWFYVLCVGCLPLLVLALVNVLLLYAVSRSHRQRAVLQRQALLRRRQDSTVMLIGVVVMFFLCQTPALVSRIIWTMESYQNHFETNPLYTFNEICNLLIILNSAGNIIPYYFFGTRFRIEFLHLFCRKQTSYDQRRGSSIIRTRRQSHVLATSRGICLESMVSSLRTSTCVILNQLNETLV